MYVAVHRLVPDMQTIAAAVEKNGSASHAKHRSLADFIFVRTKQDVSKFGN